MKTDIYKFSVCPVLKHRLDSLFHHLPGDSLIVFTILDWIVIRKDYKALKESESP